MASFDVALPIVLKFEGGYVDDPDDPGGETNRGITMSVFQECAHDLLGIDPSSANLRALTAAQAGIIYRARYWNRMQGDAIELQELANIVFDFLVNSGTNATALLQRILNEMGAALVVDGQIGKATLIALGGVDESAVYRLYKQRRIQYYEQLAAQRPSLVEFLKGWCARVNAFPDL